MHPIRSRKMRAGCDATFHRRDARDIMDTKHFDRVNGCRYSYIYQETLQAVRHTFRQKPKYRTDRLLATAGLETWRRMLQNRYNRRRQRR